MTVADDILYEVNHQPGSTELELAKAIFGPRKAYQQRVNTTCRLLVAEGQIVREGNGSPGDPLDITFLSRVSDAPRPQR